jgi:hypothetical protein
MVAAMIVFFVLTGCSAKIPGTPPDQSPLTIMCISNS